MNIFHVIKDPVHGTMQFTSTEDNWVKPFIDSPNFQRLRHIKQLGLGDLIFPGAVHSRFNHCLGCCYIAAQISHKIGLDDSQRQLVMIAALLHDIGHGPFSHAFEGIFHHKMIRHEDWTPYFLADYRGDFFDRYNKINPAQQLDDNTFDTIARMIMHQPIEKRVMADIVSSQLDADRLDYLLRDNHFCGVRYGEFDFRWMLNCMAIVDSKDGQRLGITHKGIGVVEHYLMARRLMVRNIYHSQKKLAIETLLVQLLSYLAAGLENDARFESLSIKRLGKFLIAANKFNLELQDTKNPAQLKQQFIENNYQNYKDLCDYDVFSLIRYLAEFNENIPAVQIAQRLQQRMMPKIIRLDHTKITQQNAALSEFKHKYKNDFQDWQLTITETPHQAYSGEDDPILVINEHHVIKPIGEFSFMINAISDQYEHIAFLAIDKLIADDARIIKFVNQLSSLPEQR